MYKLIENTQAFMAFTQIIHVYGAFLKERELVKNFNPESKLSPLRTKYSNSEIYRPEWDSCVQNEDAIGCLKDTVAAFNLQKEEMSKHLVTTEKYFKKLKHQFSENYPELANEMKTMLAEHQQYMENEKRQKHKAYDEVISLSKRFIAFFNYSFGTGDGEQMAYRAFSHQMLKKYMVSFDEKHYEALFSLLDTGGYKKKVPTVLSLHDIDYIASILKSIVSNVSKEDLEDMNHIVSKAENAAVARKIIAKQFIRFSKLLEDYETKRALVS